MAYETYVDTGAQPVFHHPADETSTAPRSELLRLTNIAAALVSVALVVGVGVWGYKLLMRDVTGIPVVRATEGEMRVRPDTPGGELAQHQGLAVNAVAAEGGAAKPAERLILAPQPVSLTNEDVPMDEDAVAIVQQAIKDSQVVLEPVENKETLIVDASSVAAAAESGSVDGLVAVLTEGVDPLLTEDADAGVQVAAIGTDPATRAIAESLADIPGVKSSLRPVLRPKRGPVVVEKAALSSAESRGEIDPASLPAGTRLAQLGAYDSEERARTEWVKFQSRFGDLMTDKARVVQQASSGGRVFYRLRAHGFEDLADARRFCSALVAEGGDCIPVVTR